MNSPSAFHLYSGDGTTITSRSLSLPPFERTVSIDDPRYYLADKPLRDAVNVALSLGQPLLVTGEPGTGKTQLASSLAFELGLPAPLVFQTKTSSAARDLFYRYDALRHFHDSQFRRDNTQVDEYISYEALGLAILLSLPPAEGDAYLPPGLRGQGPTRSVVLIDEVDKAPRDLPNDVLNEIENMAFTVAEGGRTFRASQAFRPVVVLTSNSEKNLPDAFLRRCVFFHIAFPDHDRLREIVHRRLRLDARFSNSMIESAIRHFEKLRGLALKKKPATAEFLQWMQVLERMSIDVNDLQPKQAEALALSYCVLAKTKEDLAIMQGTLSQA